MDNIQINLQLEGKDAFKLGMRLAERGKTVGWSIWEDDKKKHLVLHWYKPTGNTKITLFPYEMDIEQVTEFAWGWLEKEPLGSQPDHDGDNGRGFHMFTHSWGMINSDGSSFIAIRPIWAMYGK